MPKDIQQQFAEIREAGYPAAFISRPDGAIITITLAEFPHEDFVTAQVQWLCSLQYPHHAPHLHVTVQRFSSHGELDSSPLPIRVSSLEQWDATTTLLDLTRTVEAQLQAGIQSFTIPDSLPVDLAAKQKMVMAIVTDPDEMQRAEQLKTVAAASDPPAHRTSQPIRERTAADPVPVRSGLHPAVILLIFVFLLTILVVIRSSLEQAEQRRIVIAQQAAEKAALITLYNATDGANWTNNSGWLQDDDVCNWYGVTCSAGRVTELDLSRNRLSGSIPPTLGNLTSLTSLELGTNQLRGSIPPALGNLANLRFFSLDTNQLSGSIPPQVYNLVNLQYLYLSNNRLSGNISPQVGTLVNMQYLSLDNNQLSGSIPPELGALVNLIRLGLNTNQLSGSIPPELGNLTNLQGLWLHSNQLSGSIPPELGSLASLQILYLYENQLSGRIPPELANLTNVKLPESPYKYLGLEDNQLDTNVTDPALRAWLNARNTSWRYQRAP